MNSNYCRVALILDRSGSMANVRGATIEGFNEFIHGQRAIAGECSVKLVQFDDQYEEVFDEPLAKVPPLTSKTFEPRGNTALHDAMGRTIISLGDSLAAMPEEERPGKVIVVVLTDGHENASKEFTAAQVAEMVKHQTEVYKWEFMFLGANQDAVLTAKRLHIPASSSLHYAATPGGTKDVLRWMSSSIGATRKKTQSTNDHEAK